LPLNVAVTQTQYSADEEEPRNYEGRKAKEVEILNANHASNKTANSSTGVLERDKQR
jgi:hypothetical protein